MLHFANLDRRLNPLAEKPAAEMTLRRAARSAIAPSGPAPFEVAARLGVDELTPAAAAAVEGLFEEIDALRTQAEELSARLAEAERLADHDSLTPLLNRRALLRELARAQALVGRHGAPASLAYFDVDGLKAVNDRFGHRAGDTMLQAIAARLVAQVRASDAVGRLGGDEFAVILSRADALQAQAKAQALAAAIEAAPVPGGGGGVKISWGVAEIRADAEPDAIIAEADAAMYARRRARRLNLTD
jgi:diguanylate cyclase (GGDEF)-like protein